MTAFRQDDSVSTFYLESTYEQDTDKTDQENICLKKNLFIII